jgi:hypothetical protein
MKSFRRSLWLLMRSKAFVRGEAGGLGRAQCIDTVRGNAGVPRNATKIWDLCSSKAGLAGCRPDVFGAQEVAKSKTPFAKLSGSGRSRRRLRSLSPGWLGRDGLRTVPPTEPDSSAEVARAFASQCPPNTSALHSWRVVSRCWRFCQILVALGDPPNATKAKVPGNLHAGSGG